MSKKVSSAIRRAEELVAQFRLPASIKVGFINISTIIFISPKLYPAGTVAIVSVSSAKFGEMLSALRPEFLYVSGGYDDTGGYGDKEVWFLLAPEKIRIRTSTTFIDGSYMENWVLPSLGTEGHSEIVTDLLSASEVLQIKLLDPEDLKK